MLELLYQGLFTSSLSTLYSMLSILQEGGFGGLSGSPATILEEVAKQCGGPFFENAAFDDEGMIEAGVGGGIVKGAGVSGFGIRGRVDQTRETACVGGAGAHGARFQSGVEGAACQSPAACGGGCATDSEEFGMGGRIPCSLTLIGRDGQGFPSPGDDSSDRNFALFGGLLSGEQGAAHHSDVGLRRIVYQWRLHEADNSSLSFHVVAMDGARLGSHPWFRQFALHTSSDLIPHGQKRTQAPFVATALHAPTRLLSARQVGRRSFIDPHQNTSRT